jgi:hypothetical protein
MLYPLERANFNHWAQSSLCYLLHARWSRHVPPKRRLTFNRLHGVISQKIELFITTAVRTCSYMACIVPVLEYFAILPDLKRIPLRSLIK